MSTPFYDLASLVVVPSGYKSGKIYAQKPLTTDGQLTFTCASNATRVASNGLIEKVRTNLTFYSEQFDNAFWFKLGTGLTVTANTTIAPNGTLTADTLNVSNNDNVLYGSRATALDGNEFTFSIYAKGTGTFSMNIRLNSATTTTQTKTLTSEWQRFQVTVTNTVAVTSVEFFLDLNTSSTYNIWGAQVEQGVMTDYIATTTAAVSVGPVSGLPRLDYLNSSCPRLLLEGQRTSNSQFSESFDNAYWTKTNVTLTSTLGGPIDQSKYFTITCDGTAGTFKGVGKSFLNDSANTYSLSVFAKAGNSSTFVVSSRATLTANDTRAIFNLSNGTITDSSGGTATITPYGDGWYRCTFIVVNAGTYTNEASFFFGHPHGAANGATLLATGAMSEVGAYATSYIPTLGASVTRVADAASKTGISSLIGQTEGTLFVDLTEVNNLDFPEITIDNNNNTDRIVLTRSSVGNWGIFVASSAASAYTVYSTTSSTSGKFALAYSSAGYTLYRNGVQIVTGTYNLPTALSAVRLNGRSSSDFYATKKVGQLVIFKTRLSNSDLAALTA